MFVTHEQDGKTPHLPRPPPLRCRVHALLLQIVTGAAR